jgi:predicted nucleic-acid-binding protein
MKAIDTNVLVRFLVQDDDQQSAIANQLLSDAETTKAPLFVSQVVVLELIWVLQSAYNVSRSDSLTALNELTSMSALEFQDQPIIRDFLIGAQNNGCDLPDLLIAQVARGRNCETTLTFDKRAAKTPLFTGL